MSAEILNSSEDDYSPLAAINVTPFVDVVLVLLVIFIVTAPMMLKDILALQLPKVSSVDAKVAQSFGLAITRQGQFLWNGQIAAEETIAQAVRAALGRDPNIQVVISADKESLHGAVIKAIDLLKSNGVAKFAFQVSRE